MEGLTAHRSNMDVFTAVLNGEGTSIPKPDHTLDVGNFSSVLPEWAPKVPNLNISLLGSVRAGATQHRSTL